MEYWSVGELRPSQDWTPLNGLGMVTQPAGAFTVFGFLASWNLPTRSMEHHHLVQLVNRGLPRRQPEEWPEGYCITRSIIEHRALNG
jgi:hypothetical protein